MEHPDTPAAFSSTAMKRKRSYRQSLDAVRGAPWARHCSRNASTRSSITDDYHERTSLFGWNLVIQTLASLALVMSMLFFLFPTTPEYEIGMLNEGRYQLLAGIGAVIAGWAEAPGLVGKRATRASDASLHASSIYSTADVYDDQEKGPVTHAKCLPGFPRAPPFTGLVGLVSNRSPPYAAFLLEGGSIPVPAEFG